MPLYCSATGWRRIGENEMSQQSRNVIQDQLRTHKTFFWQNKPSKLLKTNARCPKSDKTIPISDTCFDPAPGREAVKKSVLTGFRSGGLSPYYQGVARLKAASTNSVADFFTGSGPWDMLAAIQRANSLFAGQN